MIECTKFTPLVKGSLKGFANIYVEKWGIEIRDISWFEKGDKEWFAFPSRIYEKDDEKKYLPYIKFKNKTHHDIFMKEVKNAILKYQSNPPAKSSDEQYSLPF